MAARGTLTGMRALDGAWNDRDWPSFGRLIAEDAVAMLAGTATTRGRAAIIDGARAFCRRFPDARVHCEQYLEFFVSHDGSRGALVARLTGTDAGTGDRLDGTIAVFSRWRGGVVVALHQFPDTDAIRRQLAGGPG